MTFCGQHNWPRYELRCLLHISLDHKLLGGWPHVPFLFGYAKIVVSVALIFVVHESLYLLQTIPLNFLEAKRLNCLIADSNIALIEATISAQLLHGISKLVHFVGVVVL